MDLLSMLDVDLPAFCAAHVRHLQKLIQEGHSGYLLIHNESSSLLAICSRMHTKPFLGASAVSQDADCSSTNADSYHLPELSFFNNEIP